MNYGTNNSANHKINKGKIMGKKLGKKQKRIFIGSVIGTFLLILLALGVNPEIVSVVSQLTGYTISVNESNTNGKLSTNQQTTQEIDLDQQLVIDFIDVGQADSILIRNQNQSMLIDAGKNEDGSKVVNFLQEKGVDQLTYAVGTHPHEDHIGGLDDVINQINVENVYMPKITTNTKTYEEVINAIQKKKLKIKVPHQGEQITIGDAQCEMMTESIENKKNLNLSSIVTRITFGETSFLMMGDAETENEKSRRWPQTDVLKVGHHGSTTSTSDAFLQQIQPELAVISVGKNNDYGHPKEAIIKRLTKMGAEIYRTDEKGTIELVSDGEKISVSE